MKSVFDSKGITILDTTLRDGMQTPGIGCNLLKRVSIAKEIAKTGVSIIEIGMPANPIDFEMIPEIANSIYEVDSSISIGVLVRCCDLDIRKTIEVFNGVKNPKYVHLFMPTSEHLLKNSVGKGKGDVISLVSKFVTKVVNMDVSFQFTPEDGAATFDRDFLMQVYRAAYDAGCRIFNVADTTGWSSTDNFVGLVEDILAEFSDIDLSCHCHNDAGLAVANSVAGVMAGVRQVEGTVLGIGERAGNVDWMSVVCTLKQIYGVESNIEMREFYSVAGRVSSVTGIGRPFCYPVVGVNSHRTSSGIHSKAVIGNAKSYHKLDPTDVGANLELVIGQTSGRAVIERKLKDIGLVSKNIGETIRMVLERCIETGEVTDEELSEIIS